MERIRRMKKNDITRFQQIKSGIVGFLPTITVNILKVLFSNAHLLFLAILNLLLY